MVIGLPLGFFELEVAPFEQSDEPIPSGTSAVVVDQFAEQRTKDVSNMATVSWHRCREGWNETSNIVLR